MTFERDSEHWLHRLSPEEWIAAGLTELARAESAFAAHNGVAAYAMLKRAAGMALNGALIVEPNERWGRSYVDHLTAIAAGDTEPQLVRDAASRLIALKPATGPVVALRTSSHENALVEAARTVMAHAYAIVYKKPREAT